MSCKACANPSGADRFWRKVDQSGDCWLWMGSRHPQGHGYSVIPGTGRVTYAHRVAWMLTHGDIPPGLEVCHKCDNPPCVRPDHMFLGTHLDNMRDSAAKKRHQYGERSVHAKFTEDDVRTIRRRHAAGEGITAMSREYGVYHGAISAICLRRNWKHVA